MGRWGRVSVLCLVGWVGITAACAQKETGSATAGITPGTGGSVTGTLGSDRCSPQGHGGSGGSGGCDTGTGTGGGGN